MDGIYTESKKRGMPWWGWLLLSPFIIFGLMMVYQMIKPETADDRLKTSQRKTIEMCWQDQGQKSLAPGSARSVAGICEGLTRDYQAKWGSSP